MIQQQLESQKRILSMMFPRQEKYHGNVCFGVKTGTGVKSMGYADINKLPEKIEKFKFYRNNDYYLTANTTKIGVRATENLFSYNNIVIDIDCHNKKVSRYELDDMIDELLYRIERDLYETGDVPQHNICVKTGRGIQLWWCMEQTATNLGWLFHCAVDSLMTQIESVIDEYSDFSYLSVDKGSSKKDVGFYRMPFTMNTKTGTLVEASIVHEERYNINDLYYAIKIEEEVKPLRKNFLQEKWERLLEKRITEIENYTEVKVKQGVIEGYRDNYAWLYYNACYQLHGEAKANEMLDELNASFIVPLKANEIRAIKKYIKSKGGLRMKNKTFYDYLGEEPVLQSKREVEREAKRLAKANRNEKVKEMYYKLKKSVKEICVEMNLSRPTVQSILCITKFKEQRDREIRTLKEQGMSTKEIAEKFRLSIRSIQIKVKEKVQQAVEQGLQRVKESILEQGIGSLHKEKTVEREYSILVRESKYRVS